DIPKPFILLSNRHVPQKRFEYAIWSLKRILREHGSVELVITGQETEYTRLLEYLADGLGVSKHVHFVGLVSELELEQLYQEASLYVYPSPEEDFGMGVVEAMAAGTPVVAWDVAGPSITVQNRVTGFLAEPYEVDPFAYAMLTLLVNPSLAENMGRASNARARQLYSMDRHIGTLARMIKFALADAEFSEFIVESIERPDELATLSTSSESLDQRALPFRYSRYGSGVSIAEDEFLK
ncbi:MAG: glycosyltransferase family 4 protein, partial [Anaerolineales bacterium]